MAKIDFAKRISYDQKMAEQYDQYAFIWKLYTSVLQTTIERNGYSSVLDLGCGTGSLLLELNSFITHGYGIDVSPSMISQARQKAANLGVVNLTFETCEIQRVKSDRKHDLIISTDGVLPYLKDGSELENLLSGIQKLLETHGTMILEFWTPETNVVPKKGKPEFPSDISNLTAAELGGPFLCEVTEIPSLPLIRYSFYCEEKPYAYVVMKSPREETVHRFFFFVPQEVKRLLNAFGFSILTEYGVTKKDGKPMLVPYEHGSKIWTVVSQRN